MVAEYQPAQNKYYFYTTDQINSTRVVTDENGNVVYAAVHDPYGGIHHTYVNAFDPVWKFSGKEQDRESGLYYFGARYYDPTLYRFLGPDPVIPTDVALYAPQRWNLYGYCLGNPLIYSEVEGAFIVEYKIEIQRKYIEGTKLIGNLYVNGTYYGITIESSVWFLPEGIYQGKFSVELIRDARGNSSYKPVILIYKNGKPASASVGFKAAIHEGDKSSDLYGCIAVDKNVMDKIVSDLMREASDYILSKVMAVSNISMYSSGVSHIFWDWFALDLISLINFIFSNEFKNMLNDAISISVKISNAS